MPMGSFHIIDGEKVSVRYSGQEWTCARCHQYKRDCPGAAVAKDCTADRVMLSSHMMEHWHKIGYKPDTDAFNEVDEVIDHEVQVGRKNMETNLIPESHLTSKYHSVIVKGFRADTSIESILEILHHQGLPAEYSSESFIKNEKTGCITLESLKPEECLSLMSNMNRKRFLNRQISVTSVVSNSPVKPAPQVQSTANERNQNPSSSPDSASDSENHIPPNLGKQLLPIPPPSPNNLTNGSPASPGVQDKINQIEQQTSSTSMLDIPNSRLDKRKSEASPESDELSRKEKKMLRDEEKKQDKMRKMLGYNEKNTLKVDFNLSH